MAKWEVVCDDVLHWAESYSGPKFHAILTDPPYELQFMGKRWDSSGVSFQPETWAALAAHLLPGAHILAFGGSRTHHRLMVAIEDAGLEIRDCIYYCFGSGFPKSLAVGKAIDRAAKAERQTIGEYAYPDGKPRNTSEHQTKRNGIYSDIKTDGSKNDRSITAPATPAAAIWEGYGTALKPAIEVIVVARKPVEGTIAENCQRYGSGALNIDGTRIPTNGNDAQAMERCNTPGSGRMHASREFPGAFGRSNPTGPLDTAAGRWPANLVLDESEAVAGLFPVMHGAGKARTADEGTHSGPSGMFQLGEPAMRFGDDGSAARFFYQATWELDQAEQLDAADVLRYCAKSSRSERDAGLDSLPLKDCGTLEDDNYNWEGEIARGRKPRDTKAHNNHPCCKPLSLCKYLATLLLPPAAYAPRRILVPFGGVGSEMIGAGLAGWDEIVGIEQELEYTQIAEARLAYWLRQPELALR